MKDNIYIDNDRIISDAMIKIVHTLQATIRPNHGMNNITIVIQSFIQFGKAFIRQLRKKKTISLDRFPYGEFEISIRHILMYKCVNIKM